jgi:hypothetical protein
VLTEKKVNGIKMIHKNKISRKKINVIISILFFIILFPQDVFSENLNSKLWINASVNESSPNTINGGNANSVGFQYVKGFNNFNTKIAISSNANQKMIFDKSYIELKSTNKRLGIGKVDRNWSFSPETSLILSKNARPANSIYFIYDNKKKSQNILTSWAGPISLEFFNSFPSGPRLVDESMLLGLRAVIEPVNNLMFEVTKTSQWGGKGYSQNLSSLLAAIGGNTNDDKNSNINQVAGFGVSYLTKIRETPSRFYLQFVGEDEAGSLPSCNMYLVGTELEFPNGTLFSKLGFEFVDTRIDLTEHNNCGPNTAYNNNVYSYTNYGDTMGASIDTEGKSFNVYLERKISEKLTFNFSIKDIKINDTNWSAHRLSSSKKSGLQAYIGSTFMLDSFRIRSNLSYQNFSLDKANVKKGLNLILNTEYIF